MTGRHLQNLASYWGHLHNPRSPRFLFPCSGSKCASYLLSLGVFILNCFLSVVLCLASLFTFPCRAGWCTDSAVEWNIVWDTSGSNICRVTGCDDHNLSVSKQVPSSRSYLEIRHDGLIPYLPLWSYHDSWHMALTSAVERMSLNKQWISPWILFGVIE
jgi:hypothetical protein